MTNGKPDRMDGYIRVSRVQGREGPAYQSPTIQRTAIEKWADYRGIRIAAWGQDEDQSGGTQDRPALNEVMRRIDDGETGGIACWNIDRFSRSVLGGLTDVRRIQDAGAHIAFVTEQIDTTGPSGQLVLTTMLAQGEYLLDNLKAGWRTAKANAIARGAHIGPTPVGYERRDDGVLRRHPTFGPIVAQAFEIAASDGLAAAVAFLQANAPGRTWTGWTTERFLRQRVYLGRVGYGDDLICEDAHEALVTRRVFEAANHAIGTAGKRKRQPSGDFPLSGIAECKSCGSHMVGGRGGADNRRVYRCAARCDAPALTTADLLEAHVVAELREAFRHPGFEVGEPNADADVALAAVEEAERELDAFAADVKARSLLKHRYHHHLEQRAEAVEEAREQLRVVLDATQAVHVVVPAELWDDLQPAELAEVLRGGLATVIVARGRQPLSERVRVVAKGMDRGALAGPEDA